MGRGGLTGELVVEFVPSGRGVAARPAFEDGVEIQMSRNTRGAAEIGDLAIITVRGRSARLQRVLGNARDARVVMEALLIHEEMGRGFPRRVQETADALVEGDPLADAARRDLTDQEVVTIDPQGAKDHDDAIAAEVDGEDVRLWVHIADVAHYVSEGDPIDREAFFRGNSVYVPGRVEPMLPARLSNDLCSLRPGATRRVVTAEMLVAPDGAITESRFYRAAIRSEQRLTYPEVDGFLDGGALGSPAQETTVNAAREAARRIRAARQRRGGLEIGGGEVVFEFDGGRVVGAHVEENTESHRIVEDCMVAANEAVAQHLIGRGRTTVFRHHPDPEQARFERLLAQMAALDVPTPSMPDRAMGPAEVRSAIGEVGAAVGRHLAARQTRGEPGGSALWTLVLRSLMQAFYTADSATHSGLASAAYLHFTSPIRRYPDLLVHRALLETIGAGVPAPDRLTVDEAALRSSERERNATDIERRADRIIGCLMLDARRRERGNDEVFDGEVVGLIPGGVFVSFGIGFEGFLRSREFDAGFLTLDDAEVQLLGEGGLPVARIGDPISVRVIEVEPLRGRARLVPADSPTRPSRGRSSRPQRRRRRF
ncbi:MAG: RNB domain-containing ribonuclease [Actinobacteria bacterium]|nr:RNB domain-containing ribonuclease [Actinomycetota bacterium]